MRILNEGDKNALIDELCDAIKWARALPEQQWQHINSPSMLRGFVSKTLDMALEKDVEAKEAE